MSPHPIWSNSYGRSWWKWNYQCPFTYQHHYPLYLDPVAVLHFCNWGGSRGGLGCDRGGTKSFNSLTPTVAIWVNTVPDRIKPSFVIFDIRALCRDKEYIFSPSLCALQTCSIWSLSLELTSASWSVSSVIASSSAVSVSKRSSASPLLSSDALLTVFFGVHHLAAFLDDLECKVKCCRNFAWFRDFGRQLRLNEWR